MDYKLLKEAVLSVTLTAVSAAIAINVLIWVVQNFSPMILAGILVTFLLGVCVAIDYERRKYLKACGK